MISTTKKQKNHGTQKSNYINESTNKKPKNKKKNSKKT